MSLTTDSAAPTGTGWQLPPSKAEQAKGAVVSTGPSGLLLGRGSGGDVTVRLFRPTPTRFFLSAPDYVKWLLAFRASCLGAHLTLVTENPRPWVNLVEIIRSCGGTVDMGPDAASVPGAGRPYRPSLVIDDAVALDGSQTSLGPWQAMIVVGRASAPSTVHELRSCDLALVAPMEAKAAENLRRAYALSTNQLKQASNLSSSEVLLAMPRRAFRLTLPPTRSEYSLLFGG